VSGTLRLISIKESPDIEWIQELIYLSVPRYNVVLCAGDDDSIFDFISSLLVHTLCEDRKAFPGRYFLEVPVLY
jgi:hypothetical protein